MGARPTTYEIVPFATDALGTDGIDELGIRWHFGAEDEPSVAPTAAELETTPILDWQVDDEVGLLVVTRDRRVLAAGSARGRYREMAKLPDDARVPTLRQFRGGITVESARGWLFAPDGGSFTSITTHGLDRLFSVRINRDGAGVAAFLPQRLAITSDGGASFRDVPSVGVLTGELGVRGPYVVAEVDLDGQPIDQLVDASSGRLANVRIDRAQTERLGTDLLRERLTQGQPWIATGPGRGRLAIAELVQDGRAAIDGDRLALFRMWRLPGATSAAQGPVFDVLGGEVGPIDEPAWPRHEPPLASSALFDETAATVSGPVLRVWSSGKPAMEISLPTGSSIAFDATGALFSVSAEKGWTETVVLRRYDLARGVVGQEWRLPSLGGLRPRLYGGGHRPALWLVTSAAASRIEGNAIGDVVPLRSGAVPVGVAHDGELLTLQAGVLAFSPSGVTMPTVATEALRMSIADDGLHGLASASTGQVFQTEDGGRHFVPIVSPQVLRPQNVLCGATRCQLGAGLVREGFACDATETVPVWKDPPPAPRPRPPSWADASGDPLPVAMRCTLDDGLFRDLPAGSLTVLPRVGELLFSATGDSYPRVRPPTTSFGEPDGRVHTSRLFPRGQVPRGWWRTGLGGNPVSRDDYAQWTMGSPPLQILGRDRRPRGFEGQASGNLFLGETAFGTIEGDPSILALWGKDGTFAAEIGLAAGESSPGIVQRGPDGEVLVIMGWGASGDVRLVRIRPGRPTDERSFALLPPSRWSTRPIAVGLGRASDGGPEIVLSEPTGDGGTELRRRRLADDSSLGPPVPVPGTQEGQEHSLTLASCPPGVGGALVYVGATTEIAVDVGTGGFSGYLRRILRVNDAGACVERTFVAGGPRLLDSRLVTAGAGGVSVLSDHDGTRGARCFPTAP